jgi:hypothetical protein
LANNLNFPVGVQTKPLPDGSVECRLMVNEREVAVTTLTQEDLGDLATNVLSAAGGAFKLSGRPKPVGHKASVNALPINGIYVGLSPQNQHVITVLIGEASLSFIVGEIDLRKIGRGLIESAWKRREIEAPAFGLRTIFGEFLVELRTYAGQRTASTLGILRRWFNSAKTRITGRSFRTIRTIDLVIGKEMPRLPSIGECIYCGAKVYSEQPGIRRLPLGAEHIVAEGLGGKLLLPDASCLLCEQITGPMVEGDVLGHTLKAFRAFHKLRSPGGRPFPKTLPLTVPQNGKDTTVEVPIEDYPIMLNMLNYVAPAILSGETGKGLPSVNAFQFVTIRYNQSELFQKHGITSFSTARWDNVMLCRMIAKIGHSFAVAILGQAKFKPLLLPLIREDDRNGIDYIGGGVPEEPAIDALHRLSIGYLRGAGKDFVAVQVRLLAKYGAPTYVAIVGESLESPIAKFRRVFSNRISSMLRR